MLMRMKAPVTPQLETTAGGLAAAEAYRAALPVIPGSPRASQQQRPASSAFAAALPSSPDARVAAWMADAAAATYAGESAARRRADATAAAEAAAEARLQQRTQQQPQPYEGASYENGDVGADGDGGWYEATPGVWERRAA